MTTLIRNGRKYPKALKRAVESAIRANTHSNKVIANDFNISTSTVAKWKRDINEQGPIPAGIRMYQERQRQIKAFNTPIFQENGTEVLYQGKTFRML